MAGPPIADGVVWIEAGRIRAVGPASEIELPDGLTVLEAEVAVPGLVDARSSVGLAGALNVEHVRDEVDVSDPVQPELRAIDAYDARDPLVEWLRSFGVTTVHTGHAPEALISGQTMVVKLRGTMVDEAVLLPEAMVSCTLGDAARHGPKATGTRARTAATLRAELQGAREYGEKRQRAEGAEPGSGEAPSLDLRKETLARVLASNTRAIPGWSIRARAWRSWSKRATAPWPMSRRSTFNATRRRTGRSCCALNTTAKPPSPRRSSSVYAPTRTPGSSGSSPSLPERAPAGPSSARRNSSSRSAAARSRSTRARSSSSPRHSRASSDARSAIGRSIASQKIRRTSLSSESAFGSPRGCEAPGAKSLESMDRPCLLKPS